MGNSKGYCIPYLSAPQIVTVSLRPCSWKNWGRTLSWALLQSALAEQAVSLLLLGFSLLATWALLKQRLLPCWVLFSYFCLLPYPRETENGGFKLPWDEFRRCPSAVEVSRRQKRSSRGTGPDCYQPWVAPAQMLCLALPALLSPAVRRALTPEGLSGLHLPLELLHELLPSWEGSDTILSLCLSHTVAPVRRYLRKGCSLAFWISLCSHGFVRFSYFVSSSYLLLAFACYCLIY